LGGSIAAAGAVAAWASRTGRVGRALSVLLAVGCLAIAAIPPDSYARAFSIAGRSGSGGETLFYREGTTDTVAVVKRDYGFRDVDAKSEIVNGIAMTATVKPVWRYMAAEGHLPALFAPAGSRGLVICVGTGITLGAVASHDEVPEIDAIDLSESVLAALPVFARENGEVLRDPKVHVVHDDGRHALALSRLSYGLITLEPPPPIVAGSVNLYTLDFYRTCRRHLVPGGIVAQWLPLHAQSLASAQAAARTFLEAFPEAQLWLPSIRDAVLLGSDRPLTLDAARLRASYLDPKTRANLETAYLETPQALAGTFLLDRAGIARWASGADLITDDRPWMEFFHRYGATMSDREIATLLEPTPGSFGWLAGEGASALRAEAEDARRAHLLYLRSEIADDAAAARQAAASDRATRFGRYRLGCDTPQLAALARSTGNGEAWRRQVDACGRIFGP
jgi:spermidine synthase